MGYYSACYSLYDDVVFGMSVGKSKGLVLVNLLRCAKIECYCLAAQMSVSQLHMHPCSGFLTNRLLLTLKTLPTTKSRTQPGNESQAVTHMFTFLYPLLKPLLLYNSSFARCISLQNPP